MLKKIKEFGERPIRWKDYGIFYVVATVIGIITLLVYYLYLGIIEFPKFRTKHSTKDSLEEES